MTSMPLKKGLLFELIFQLLQEAHNSARLEFVASLRWIPFSHLPCAASVLDPQQKIKSDPPWKISRQNTFCRWLIDIYIYIVCIYSYIYILWYKYTVI